MTCADVEGWLIALFAASADAPVFSPRPLPRPALPRGGFDCYHIAIAVLGADSPELRALFTWARAKARRRIGRHRRLRASTNVPGGTVTDHCIAFGVNRRTFDRRRKRACERVAEVWSAELAAAGCPSTCRDSGRLLDREARA